MEIREDYCKSLKHSEESLQIQQHKSPANPTAERDQPDPFAAEVRQHLQPRQPAAAPDR